MRVTTEREPLALTAAELAGILGLDFAGDVVADVMTGLFPPADAQDGATPLRKAETLAEWLREGGLARLIAGEPERAAAWIEIDRAWESGCLLCGSKPVGVVVVRPTAAGIPSSVHAVGRGHAGETESDEWYAARGMDVRRPEARKPEGGGR